MKIAIASDHAGFEQKQLLLKHLADAGHNVTDLGPENDSRVDYPDFAQRVAEAVSRGCADRGILICGTGIGMAISANKVFGVRAVNVTNVEFAKLSREHNDSNILCLSGRFVDVEENIRCVDAFLETDFAGGRHEARVKKMMALEHADE